LSNTPAAGWLHRHWGVIGTWDESSLLRQHCLSFHTTKNRSQAVTKSIEWLIVMAVSNGWPPVTLLRIQKQQKVGSFSSGRMYRSVNAMRAFGVLVHRFEELERASARELQLCSALLWTSTCACAGVECSIAFA